MYQLYTVSYSFNEAFCWKYFRSPSYVKSEANRREGKKSLIVRLNGKKVTEQYYKLYDDESIEKEAKAES